MKVNANLLLSFLPFPILLKGFLFGCVLSFRVLSLNNWTEEVFRFKAHIALGDITRTEKTQFSVSRNILTLQRKKESERERKREVRRISCKVSEQADKTYLLISL
jgi:hypothetical protein